MALTYKNIKNVLRNIEQLKDKGNSYWSYISYLEAALQSFDALDAFKDKDYKKAKQEIVYKYKRFPWSKSQTKIRLENKDELIIRLAKQFVLSIDHTKMVTENFKKTKNNGK